MTTLLLKTKLYIPPVRSELVSRPRLVKRLNAGLARKLTLISAPAGFGKTTLVTAWLNSVERPFAWLSLDAGDNHPLRFWRYVVAALQTVNTAIGEDVLPALESPQPPPLEALVTALTNDIVAASQTAPGAFPCILVLDDYHVIKAQAIHESLNFWLDHLPPALHLLLTTRSDPPLALSRRRGRAEMTELRAVDLRFTVEEASAFFNQAMGLDLAAEDIAALERRTEGWIVGLQMAAISMQGTADRHAFVTSFAGDDRYVADYLMEEVLQQQPQHIQDFLLQTSILNALHASLCDAVCGRSGSQDTLTGLEQSNLFIVPLDNSRDWYRYHHLFADLLRRRLSRASGDVTELHRRAAEWYEWQGTINQAIHHSLAAKDFHRAARLIELHAETLEWQHGVLGWLNELPQELLHARPRLCLVAAWALHTFGQLDEIEPYLQAIESHLQDAGFDLSADADRQPAMSPGELAQARRVMGEALNIRALVTLMQGNPSRAIEQFQQTLTMLPQDARELRRNAAIGLAEAYYLRGNVSFASQAYAKAIEHSQDKEDMMVAVSLTRLAELELIAGRLHQATETYRQMQQLVADQDKAQHYISGLINYGRGNLLRERNELVAAEHQFRQGIVCGARWAEPRLLLACHSGLARVLQAQGDRAGALQAIEEAVQIERRHGITWAWGLPSATTLQARIRLAQGDLESAARWAREQNLQTGDELAFSHEIEYLTLARVLVVQGAADAALELLARLRQAAKAGGRTGRVIEILALRALALQALGDLAGALDTLAQALALAEAEGYARIFVDEGAPMARLLYRALERGIAPEYAARLLAAYEAQDEAAEPKAPQVEPLIEALSEREVEVLQLLAEGSSNREIAHKLSISLGTVKAHNSNVYGKLGVNSRTQAVARARTMGLL